MFAAVFEADARGLQACEALRGRTQPEELEVCFTEIRASVHAEVEALRALMKLPSFEAAEAVEAIASDVEWKTGIIAEFSFEFRTGWADSLVACWAEKPWLRDLQTDVDKYS